MCSRRKLTCFLWQQPQDYSSCAPLRISHILYVNLASPTSDCGSDKPLWLQGHKDVKCENNLSCCQGLKNEQVSIRSDGSDQSRVWIDADWSWGFHWRKEWKKHMDGGEGDVHRAPGGWRRRRTWECWQEVAYRGCKTHAFITTCTGKPHMNQVKQSTVTYGYTLRNNRAVKTVWNDINRQEDLVLVLSNFNIV